MKDETCEVPIKSFVGLKSKRYTFTKEDSHECKKAKDNNKPVVDDELKHEHVLLIRSYVRHEMNRIQSKGHNMITYSIKSNFLSCSDDK